MSNIRKDLRTLMSVPGLSGHEDGVRIAISERLDEIGLAHRTDRLGNLIATVAGEGPSVMLFAHMDQLGFVVRKIEEDGFIRVERLGGVPERALPSQDVMFCIPNAQDVYGIIANKSHHATRQDEKYKVLPVADLFIDVGLSSKVEVEATGIRIGSPVVYARESYDLGPHRVAGCAVQLAVAEALTRRTGGPTVHLVFSVQEEFNLRGAQVAAQALTPDMAIQIDLMLASDTPDMADRGEMVLGGGPGISLYSFHGRGTLNGVIPHPAMVRLMEETAEAKGVTLQRSAQTGVLTDLSYVQLVGEGVAAIDVGFPMRYSHSSREVCDIRDLEGLATLLTAALARMGPDFSLERL